MGVGLQKKFAVPNGKILVWPCAYMYISFAFPVSDGWFNIKILIQQKEERTMLWIIGVVAAILVVIWFVSMLFDIFYAGDWEDALWDFIKTVVAGVVVVGCLFALGGILSMRYEETNQSGEWNLVALHDNRQIEGHGAGGLFFVRVSVDTKPVYNFYYQLENGGFRQGTIDVSNAIIFEQDDTTPHIVRHTVDVRNRMPRWLHNTLAFGAGNKQYNTWELFVPTGSIVQDFTLDLR